MSLLETQSAYQKGVARGETRLLGNTMIRDHPIDPIALRDSLSRFDATSSTAFAIRSSYATSALHWPC